MNVQNRRIGRRKPAPRGHARTYGTLDGVTDSEHRSLRSIGATTGEVAARTVALLHPLRAVPGVRIFRGVRPLGEDLPPIPLAISKGRLLILVESVAWPAGSYRVGLDGAIQGDSVYIGQSTSGLSAAVRHWRGRMPDRHVVAAIVIVHSDAADLVELRRPPLGNVSWALAEDAPRVLRRAVHRRCHEPSHSLIRLLMAATVKEDINPTNFMSLRQ